MGVLDWEGSWVFASTALVVAEMALYLTGYSDCLNSFHERLSPPYGCHTSLKMSSTITEYASLLLLLLLKNQTHTKYVLLPETVTVIKKTDTQEVCSLTGASYCYQRTRHTHSMFLYRRLFSNPVPDAPAEAVGVVYECFQDDVTVAFVKLANQRCASIQTETDRTKLHVTVSHCQSIHNYYKVQNTESACV